MLNFERERERERERQRERARERERERERESEVRESGLVCVCVCCVCVFVCVENTHTHTCTYNHLSIICSFKFINFCTYKHKKRKTLPLPCLPPSFPPSSLSLSLSYTPTHTHTQYRWVCMEYAGPLPVSRYSIQFSRFTRTKVQILTQKALVGVYVGPRWQL